KTLHSSTNSSPERPAPLLLFNKLLVLSLNSVKVSTKESDGLEGIACDLSPIREQDSQEVRLLSDQLMGEVVRCVTREDEFAGVARPPHFPAGLAQDEGEAPDGCPGSGLGLGGCPLLLTGLTPVVEDVGGLPEAYRAGEVAAEVFYLFMVEPPQHRLPHVHGSRPGVAYEVEVEGADLEAGEDGFDPARLLARLDEVFVRGGQHPDDVLEPGGEC